MNEVKVIEVFMNGVKVGRIAMTPDFLCAFEYDPAFVITGNSISPFHLPLKQELFVAKRAPFHGGFGVFDDSLPDGWGNLILDRYLSSKSIDPNKLTILQRLALIGSTGRGALEYRPDYSATTADEMVHLDHLAHEAEKILTAGYEPGSGFNGFHTTTINHNGEPTVNDIMAVAAKVGLNKQRTTAIVEEIHTRVSESEI